MAKKQTSKHIETSDCGVRDALTAHLSHPLGAYRSAEDQVVYLWCFKCERTVIRYTEGQPDAP